MIGSEQNTSTAVMQRRNPNTDNLDFYPTPPWATRALAEHVLIPLLGRSALKEATCWEPAAGHGDMAHPLASYFARVVTSDIHDHGKIEHRQHDFLMPFLPPWLSAADWIITNPPFALAEQFIERARRISGWQGTAMLVRIAFLEGVGRYQRLFSLNPPTVVAQFTERVVMHHGKLSPKGSTATAYCWLVWASGIAARPMMWIPPCRKRLERPSDYSEPASDAGDQATAAARGEAADHAPRVAHAHPRPLMRKFWICHGLAHNVVTRDDIKRVHGVSEEELTTWCRTYREEGAHGFRRQAPNPRRYAA